MLRALGGLVFPRRCASCGAPAEWLCAACDESFPWLRSACARCALPTVIPVEACARCRARPPAFALARAVARYEGCARDALIAFKVAGERRAAREMAARMAAVAPRADLVTFVPATRRAIAERGFNPAEELARRVARRLGLPCAPLLRKTRETRDQSTLGREARARNVADAFRAIEAPVRAAASRADDPRILLVDDVMTTGATARACAGEMRVAGMGQIAILTFARAG
jgi:predicted amidophosphoribosyltransferase